MLTSKRIRVPCGDSNRRPNSRGESVHGGHDRVGAEESFTFRSSRSRNRLPTSADAAAGTERIAWRLQALAQGDLSERARQRASELANDADLRLSPPRHSATAVPVAARPNKKSREGLPPPGTILRRTYKGQVLEVKILEQGCQLDGRVYRSLSAVAKAITGSHCSGLLFFRLTQKGEA